MKRRNKIKNKGIIKLVIDFLSDGSFYLGLVTGWVFLHYELIHVFLDLFNLKKI